MLAGQARRTEPARDRRGRGGRGSEAGTWPLLKPKKGQEGHSTGDPPAAGRGAKRLQDDADLQGCRERGKTKPSGWEGGGPSSQSCQRTARTPWCGGTRTAPRPATRWPGPLWHKTAPATPTSPALQGASAGLPHLLRLQAPEASRPPALPAPRPLPPTTSRLRARGTEAPTVCALRLPHRAWHGAGHTSAAEMNGSNPHLLARRPQLSCSPPPHPASWPGPRTLSRNRKRGPGCCCAFQITAGRGKAAPTPAASSGKFKWRPGSPAANGLKELRGRRRSPLPHGVPTCLGRTPCSPRVPPHPAGRKPNRRGRCSGQAGG